VIRILQRILKGLYGLCAVLSAACLASIAIVILAGAIGRFLGIVVPSANAIAGYLVAASTFLALAPTLRSGGHIRVELFASRLGPRTRHILELWCLVWATVLVAYLAWSSLGQVMNSYKFDSVSSGLLAIPMWIPQSSMAFGLAVMTLALVELLIATLCGQVPAYRDGDALATASDDAGPA
jgi:TRAP-type C4-dicarboxylate transport system permease small subunit